MSELLMQHLKRVTAICLHHADAADRQSLMIYAKDRQIAELTRMLFAIGKQDGQKIRELTEENRGLRQMLHMEPR